MCAPTLLPCRAVPLPQPPGLVGQARIGREQELSWAIVRLLSTVQLLFPLITDQMFSWRLMISRLGEACIYATTVN